MKTIGRISPLALAMAVIALTSMPLAAGGLSTQLGEVVIQNLQISQSYNLRELANLQLIVTNTGKESVNLRMDILKPEERELRQEAAAIPDVSWITLSRDTFSLGPQEPARADIIITIPDDSQYLGKKYQVIIWSHTVGDGSTFMEVGLKSRIIFTTDTIKADVEEMVTSSNANVNFTLQPEEIYLSNVPQGMTYDVSDKAGHVLTITNHGDREQTFRLVSRSVENSVTTLIEEYDDAPDASYLQFSASEFVLEPDESKTIKMYLKFPNNREYTGRQYMFVVHLYTINEDIMTGVYSRLFASVR